MNFENVMNVVLESNSKADILRLLGYSINGRNHKKLNNIISEHSIDISHFDVGKKHRKYVVIEKECPVCGTKFETKMGSKGERVTCSHSCSNSYFRSGPNNPNWKDEAYRSTCFHHHDHKCVICDEDKILDVHHFDGDRTNNSPENLIPLCPTHHMYWHSRYKHLIENEVVEYRDNFINRVVD